MLYLICLGLALTATATADPAIQKIAYLQRHFGDDPLPALDKGYVLFLTRPTNLGLYDPKGMRIFETVIEDSKNGFASAGTVAIDTDGTIAAGGVHRVREGYAGAIILLDRTGRVIGFQSTGRYMPAHICFDSNRTIWASGWQRDAGDNSREDKEDYLTVRHYTKDGRELGAFLPRSTFARSLSPFGSGMGLWRIRAAQNTIGALVHQQEGHPPEWVELDLQGNLAGRWNLGSRLSGGMAYTADGRLYGKMWDPKSKRPFLLLLDKESGKWTTVLDTWIFDGQDLSKTLLLGADGNDLVLAEHGGARLVWVRAPR